jgi:hypothetical protein
MPSIYDYEGPRITRDYFQVRVVKDGELSAVPNGPYDILREAREAADRMAANWSPPVTIYELDWRQRVENFTEDGVYIECCRVLNMKDRIFA